MIISKIWNNSSEEIKEGLAVGLAGGLLVGLAGGLAWGLAWGLAGGLAGGLVWGLAGGLVMGLAVILTNFSEALPFLANFPSILILIFSIIFISEILFWLMPKEKLKKGTSIFWHTVKRKGENILEVLLFLSGIAQIYILTRELNKYLDYQLFQELLKWIGYIGAGILIIVLIGFVLYVWIKLNEVKYRK